MSKSFDVAQMMEDMDGGTLKEQLSHAVHEVAKSVVLHGDAKSKGKVSMTFDITRVKNAQQVIITHKLEYKALTPKGSTAEVRSNESPMHVSANGVTLMPDNQQQLFERSED